MNITGAQLNIAGADRRELGCYLREIIRNNVKEKYSRRYMKNAYRVLLTRARQGLEIYVPQGNTEDSTALPSLYDETYNYLRSIGIVEL